MITRLRPMRAALVFLALAISAQATESSRASGLSDIPANSLDQPCAGQADREKNGDWKHDYRNGRYLCWCKQMLYPVDNASNPCRDEDFLAERDARLGKTEKVRVESSKYDKDCVACGAPTVHAEVSHNTPVVLAITESLREKVSIVPKEKTSPPVAVARPVSKKLSPEEKRNFLARIHKKIELRELKSVFVAGQVNYANPKAARAELRELAQLLKDYPNVRIGIYGTTHSYDTRRSLLLFSKQFGVHGIDPNSINESGVRMRKLAQSRANACKRLIIESGIPQARIKFSRGVEQGRLLRRIGKTFEEDVQENRRILIEYFDDDGTSLNPIDPTREIYR